MTHTIVEGTEEPQDFQLLDDGVALVGTGLTLGIEFRETTAGVEDVSVAWLDQATGTVRASGIENLARGTYHVRFTLTDSGGNVGYAPNGVGSDEWRVVRV